MSDILAIGHWRTNADLIADVACLGYITGRVLDLSYGEGGFWKTWWPKHDDFTTNDLDPTKPSQWHYDATSTPWEDGSFDTVVWDPPYKLQGTPASGEMDGRYGTGVKRSRDEVGRLMCDGISEAARLSTTWVLVKTMDQVNGGRVRWLTDDATEHARGIGLRKVDSFLLRGGRPQPAGRRQEHARRNFSTLLVFGKR